MALDLALILQQKEQNCESEVLPLAAMERQQASQHASKVVIQFHVAYSRRANSWINSS